MIRAARNHAQEPPLKHVRGGIGDLPDVNVWLALAIKEHPHHQPAMRYWADGARPDTWFCRVTMLGLVRLLTQPAVAGDSAMSAKESLRYYQNILSLPKVAGLATEPLGVERILQTLLQNYLSARYLTDAYLAAFAISKGFRLVTFDRDFERFDGLTQIRLIS